MTPFRHHRGPAVLVLGGERQGLSAELRALCDVVVRIPMVGPTDSLNLSVAAGVLLYEVFNQRRHGSTRAADRMRTMIVLCTTPEQLEDSASTAELATVAEAARLAGCRVYYIPPDFSRCETAENALAHIPPVPAPVPAIWNGFIPPPDVYAAIYEAAIAKNIRLLNTPEQHRTAMEFDRFYPRLDGLTPEIVVIHGPEECAAAIERLDLPVFVKGMVKSSKAEGWEACVASSLDELVYITSGLLRWTSRSRGAVVVRRLVRLRHTRTSGRGFPAGREFRVFLHNGNVLDYSYYWDGEDALATLAADEEQAVLDLARLAARRLGVPFAAGGS